MAKNDKIEELREKFSDFEAPLPENGWLRIEQSLDSALRTKAIRRNIIFGAIAASVAILIVGGLLLFNLSEVDNQPLVATGVQQEMTITDIPQSADKLIAQTDNAKTENFGKDVASSRKQKTVSKAVDAPQPELFSSNVNVVDEKNVGKELAEAKIADKTEEAALTEAPQPRKESQPQMDAKERERIIKEFEDAGKADRLFADVNVRHKEKNRTSLVLNGKSGLNSYTAGANSPMILRTGKYSDALEESDLVLNSSKNSQAFFASPTNSIRVDNTAQMHHSQPVSFGFTVSRSFDNRLSAETGLVYTYLYSRAENSSRISQTLESHRFHYLGVPLHVNYVFFSWNKFNLFGSVGGTVEKDIYGSARYFGEMQNEALNTVSESYITKKIEQENFQFSIDAGLGLSYPIYDRLQLYGKIGSTYYFDAKNEYRTIYSDKKILLDMNAGLRIEF